MTEASTTATEGGGGRPARLIIDVSDMDRAAAFWSGMLGGEAEKRRGQYQTVGRLPGGLRVILQEVPEAKAVKNRLHLDFDCDDVEAAMRRVEALGGRKVRTLTEGGYSMIVAADTEGNEFCLTPSQG